MTRTERVAENYKKARELVLGGMARKDAIKQAGIGQSTYWRYQKGLLKKKPDPEIKAKRKTSHVFLDLEHAPITKPQTNQQMVVIFCQPDQLKTVLQNGGIL